MHRGQVGADHTENLRALQRAKAARDLLLHLGHAHRLLGDVVREGHPGIGGKAPDIVGILAQPRDQVGRFALLDAPALARGARAWVFAFGLAQNLIVDIAQMPQLHGGQRRTALCRALLRLREQLDHVQRPGLVLLLVHVGQLAQVVRVAQPVRALQGPVGCVPSFL